MDLRLVFAPPRIIGRSTTEARLDTLVTIHSLVRWLVLLALVGGVVVAFGAARRPGEAFANPVFSGVAISVDVQVVIGLILYIFNEGWDQGAFIAYIHPIAMVLALGVAHVAIARGRRTSSHNHAAGNRIVGVGLVVSLLLIMAAIPWERL